MAKKKKINDYNEFLIKFMQGKADKLKEIDCDIEYFTEKDISSIKKWSKKESKRIWSMIKSNDNLKGLSISSCPFCLHNAGDCNICEYMYTHGKCRNDNSDYKRILEFFKNYFCTETTYIFDTDFYRKLKKEIEKEGV